MHIFSTHLCLWFWERGGASRCIAYRKTEALCGVVRVSVPMSPPLAAARRTRLPCSLAICLEKQNQLGFHVLQLHRTSFRPGSELEVGSPGSGVCLRNHAGFPQSPSTSPDLLAFRHVPVSRVRYGSVTPTSEPSTMTTVSRESTGERVVRALAGRWLVCLAVCTHLR